MQVLGRLELDPVRMLPSLHDSAMPVFFGSEEALSSAMDDWMQPSWQTFGAMSGILW